MAFGDLLQQRAFGATTNGGTAAYNSNVSAGTLLVAQCWVSGNNSSNGVASITDTRGNTWARAIQSAIANGTARCEIWYAANANAGANTLTINWAGSPTNVVLHMAEFDGFPDGVTEGETNTNIETTNTTTRIAGEITTTATAVIIAIIGFESAFSVSARPESFTGLTATIRADHSYRVPGSGVTTDAEVTCGDVERGPGAIAAFYATEDGGGGDPLPWLYRLHTHTIMASIAGGAVIGATASLTHFLGFGGATDDGFTYRARTDQAATIALEYSTSSDLSGSTTTAGVSVVSGDDFTGEESITGLTADTVYYCCPKVNGVRVMSAPFPQMKTFPTEGTEDAVIVFGSCMNSPVESSVFASMRAENPDLFIHLGDFHYGNTTVLADLRTAYQAMYQDDYYEDIVRHLPTAHTWDDHEYGGNNEDGQMLGKANALQAHIEYRPLYALESASNGVYHQFVIANADVFVLDLRYNRRGGSGTRWPDTHLAVVTPDGASSGTTVIMAGNGDRQFTGAFDGWYYKNSAGVVERVVSSVWDGGTSKHTCTLSRSVTDVDSLTFHLRNKSMMDDGVVGQLDWLVDGINASTKRWKLIVSSVIFNPTYDTNSDAWAGFDSIDDMEQLYLIQHITADNVLVLSGDRHRSAIDDGTNSHWPECTASPLVQNQATLAGTWTNGMTTIDAHYYGLLELSATQAVFTIRNANGTTNAQVTPLTVAAA